MSCKPNEFMPIFGTTSAVTLFSTWLFELHQWPPLALVIGGIVVFLSAHIGNQNKLSDAFPRRFRRSFSQLAHSELRGGAARLDAPHRTPAQPEIPQGKYAEPSATQRALVSARSCGGRFFSRVVAVLLVFSLVGECSPAQNLSAFTIHSPLPRRINTSRT